MIRISKNNSLLILIADKAACKNGKPLPDGRFRRGRNAAHGLRVVYFFMRVG
ncbi:hypothetical protein LHK_02339 [Laribacter hongkongensis HLHK9]|uniref:Uncharacterized protein n=1 Tax=Laribacter hongkongensis (strain HLHK9) TaxID=557598 RepID=C1DAY2_LARHH|nr:hypothetical protein LHK_02339 [Laribacter hongkongensis HLHK9]